MVQGLPQKIKNILLFCLRHWPGIFAALCAAVLVVAPLAAFPFVARDAYHGINIAHFGDDEHYYLTRMEEALEGHALGQPILAEGKGAQDPTFSYVELAIAFPLRLVGIAHLDATALLNTLNAIGVFVVVLLMYAFMFSLSGDGFLAAALALFAVCGYSIVYNKGLFYSDFDIYGRSLWPWASSIPFFAFLIALYKSVVIRTGKMALVAAAVLFGVLFYVYFYAWTFALALLCALVLMYLLAREWRRFLEVCIVGAGGLLIGAFNVTRLLVFYATPTGKQLAFFLNQQHSHAAVFSKIGFVAAIIVGLFSLYAWKRRDKSEFPVLLFLWAVICAGWIALDQQVLSGRLVQYGHYYWYFIVPLSIMVIGYCVYKFLPARFRFVLPTTLVVLALLNSSVGQYRSFSTTYDSKIREQTYAPLLSKLNTLPTGTVFTGSGGDVFEFLITIYTQDNLYWMPAAELHVFPIDRLKETLLVYLSLNPIARKDPAIFLSKELAAGVFDQYTGIYRELEAYRSGLDYSSYQLRTATVARDPVLAPLRIELLAELAQQYRATFLQKGAARTLLQKEGVAYVLWDKRQYPDWDLSPLQPLALLATSTDLALYALR